MNVRLIDKDGNLVREGKPVGQQLTSLQAMPRTIINNNVVYEFAYYFGNGVVAVYKEQT